MKYTLISEHFRQSSNWETRGIDIELGELGQQEFAKMQQTVRASIDLAKDLEIEDCDNEDEFKNKIGFVGELNNQKFYIFNNNGLFETEGFNAIFISNNLLHVELWIFQEFFLECFRDFDSEEQPDGSTKYTLNGNHLWTVWS